VFVTTDNDDIFEIKVVFNKQLLLSVLTSLSWLARKSDDLVMTRQMEYAKQRGVNPAFFEEKYFVLNFEYRGEELPTNNTQKIKFINL